MVLGNAYHRLQYAEHEQVFAQGCDNEESEEWVASLKLGAGPLALCIVSSGEAGP